MALAVNNRLCILAAWQFARQALYFLKKEVSSNFVLRSIKYVRSKTLIEACSCVCLLVRNEHWKTKIFLSRHTRRKSSLTHRHFWSKIKPCRTFMIRALIKDQKMQIIICLPLVNQNPKESSKVQDR